MASTADRPLYFSFFMFTANLQPGDRDYARTIARHMQALREFGYAGFDLPIAPPAAELDAARDLGAYEELRGALDDAGLSDVRLTTNVAATRTFNISSPFAEQRALGLAYLRSRVEITRALRGDAMAGPIVIPYGVFPTTDAGQPIWSDALQQWLAPRYKHAQPELEKLGEFAAELNVKVAIEPVDHWETPSPNLVGDVAGILDGVASTQVGVCIDSAHVVLGAEGLDAFTASVAKSTGRIHYVHISAPDRGAVKGSWIPWQQFLKTVLPVYEGPLLVEVFNAIPVFQNPLRLTRRKFWIPGEDEPVAGWPDAYTVAREGLAEVRAQLASL